MVSLQELQFENQIQAAQKIVEILPNDLVLDDYLMMCSSLESVIVADIVAKELKVDYEIMFCEPIYAPHNNECVIAMVSETEEIVLHENLIKSFDITLGYVFGEAHRKYEEKVLKNVYKYRKGKLLGELANKNILLIDEGCETGLTAEICVKTLLSEGVKSITYVTPLISTDIADELNVLVDKVYAVHKIANFVSVDFYYKDKIIPSFEIITSILEESPYYLPLQKGDKNAS